MMYHQKAPHRNWMPAPRHLGIFNNTTFPEPANLFDDYEGRGRAAREQDMSIEHTLTNDWDLKLLTREEMLKDTTNRLYSVYKRMPVEVQDKWDSVYAGRIAEYRKGDLKGKSLISWKYQQYMRDYLATVLAVDENIGRLLNYLEKLVNWTIQSLSTPPTKVSSLANMAGLTNASCMKNVNACRLLSVIRKQLKQEVPVMPSA